MSSSTNGELYARFKVAMETNMSDPFVFFSRDSGFNRGKKEDKLADWDIFNLLQLHLYFHFYLRRLKQHLNKDFYAICYL